MLNQEEYEELNNLDVRDDGLGEERRVARNKQQELTEYWLTHSAETIYNELRKSVFGQDEALKKASILIYAFLKRVSENEFAPKPHFLLEGQSGCGKSTFINALKKISPVPVIRIDSSVITQAGFKGIDPTQWLSDYEDELDEACGCGIVCFDEIDKLMKPCIDASGDNINLRVLEQLLVQMDGGAIQTKNGVINTNRLLFIGMGAFSSLRVTEQKNGVGFCSEINQIKQKERRITRDDIMSFCSSEQFVGRFVSVLSFKNLGYDEYRKICINAISEIQYTFGEGALIYTDEFVDKIVNEARHSAYGCRNIRNAVWESFLNNNNLFEKPKISFLEREIA